MIETLWWMSVMAGAVVTGLLVVAVVWLVWSALRNRLRARLAAELAAKFRPAAAAGEKGQSITVDELVARIEAEGQPVRLNWEDDEFSEEPKQWPTGIMPRVEPEE